MRCNLRQMAESCKTNFPLEVNREREPHSVWLLETRVLFEMNRLIGHVMMYKTALG